MKLPFVSRERFDEAREQIAALEKERQQLFDRILVLSGQKPIFGELPKAVELPAPDLTGLEPIQGKPTLANITAKANKEAHKRAAEGKDSIIAELRKAESLARKDAHAS